MGDPFVEDLLDRLEPLGRMRARKMFGGTGLYCDGVFFALVAGGVLYFKVDAENLAPYLSAGMERFRPFEERASASFGYYEVPLEVQERAPSLVEWARDAVAAARRRAAPKALTANEKSNTKTGKKAKSKTKSKANQRPTVLPPESELKPPSSARAGKTSVRRLVNIDSAIAGWLEGVGIHTRADLERVGALKTFEKLRAARIDPTLEHLWALEGALLGVRSERVTPQMRERLLMRIRRYRG